MTVVLINDSDNYTHQIWAQEQAASCAVASLWMARNQAKQSTAMEEEWALAWRLYNRVVLAAPAEFMPLAPAPRTFDPKAYKNDQNTFEDMFSNAGTFMSQVSAALQIDGLKVTFATPFGKGITVDAARISDTTPAIVLLGWYSGATRNGGHFIVASRVTGSGKIAYLDPWGGKLRELGSGPNYPPTGVFEQVIYISR